MRRIRLTLLTRPGCHLCEELEAELLAEFGEAVEVDAVNVDAHAQWQALYGLSIPVLLSDSGEFLCAVQLDADAIRQLL